MRKKIILITLFILLVGIQLIRVDQTNPVSNINSDYFSVSSAPVAVVTIMKESCYDCHSNQTVYPWYSKIAPVSWLMQYDVNEAREHINFSDWGNYTADDRYEMLEECMEEIADNKMPLKKYVLMHSNAKLTNEEKEILRNWFLKSSATSVIAVLN